MNYSQNKEQEVILKYFEGQSGTFLDLGCNDCKTFSNTRALFETGRFKGVFVDPSPKAIERCRELYKGHKGVYIYEFAIGSSNGKAMLQESGPLIGGDVGLVSTFHPHEMDRFKRTVNYAPIEVKTFKWKTFLNRLTIKEFDFISADCEGSEMSFLPDMNLTKTKLICLEHNGKQDLKNQYLECTSKYGIDKLIYESGENIIIGR